jgi:hypothetical protein
MTPEDREADLVRRVAVAIDNHAHFELLAVRDAAARAAIAVIRPTIVEEVLREIYNAPEIGGMKWRLLRYAQRVHGLDLAQDGER